MEYVHGGDIYTHKGMTDFSVNLNPFGPGRAVVEAARKSIDQLEIHPDASCRKLKSALAKDWKFRLSILSVKWGGRSDFYGSTCGLPKESADTGSCICGI